MSFNDNWSYNRESEWGKKSKFCEVCNLSITNNMWCLHKKSKEHLNNLKDKSLIKDDEYNQILEKVKKQKSEKIYCNICDRWISRRGLSEHKRTKIHLENVEKNDKLMIIT